MRLDEHLNLLDSGPVLIGAATFQAGTSAGSTINVAMSAATVSTVTATVSPAGLVIAPPVELTTAVSQSMTSLAADDIDFHATWVENSTAGRTARMGRVSNDGTPLDGAGIPLVGTL